MKANPIALAEDIAKLPVTVIALEKAPEQLLNDIEKSQNKRENRASILVNFVIERAELFRDTNREVYARDYLTNETRKIGSNQFKTWLTSSFFEACGKVSSEQSVREAVNALSGMAILNGDCRDVHIRAAKQNESYYIDLAIPHQSDAICVTAEGWSVIAGPPVRFLRAESMHALPMPVKGGDILDLWDLINIQEKQRILALTWIIDALRPDSPFTVLELIGEQGSAKSTTQALLRRLIDPNACDLRASPKKAEDIFVTAGINWVVSYENVSHFLIQHN